MVECLSQLHACVVEGVETWVRNRGGDGVSGEYEVVCSLFLIPTQIGRLTSIDFDYAGSVRRCR